MGLSIKFPCNTTVEIKDHSDYKTISAHLPTSALFKLGDKTLLLVNYQSAQIIRDYLNEKFPVQPPVKAEVAGGVRRSAVFSLSEQMEAELEPRHWTGTNDIGPVLKHGRD
jgi:hypothetical protein